MRAKTFLFVTALLAGWVSAAGAQQSTGQQSGETTAVSPWQTTLQNWLDAGVRITDTSGDRARFERYRDPRTGPFLDRLRWEGDKGNSIIAVALDNVGYRDQRLFGQFNVPGKMRLSVEWNQIPQFWSIDTRSPYTGIGTSVQTLPSSLPRGATAPLQYNNVPLGTFDARTRRDTLTFNFLYNATQNLDLNLRLSTARRDGEQPWAVSAGFAGAHELAAPVDTRTTDLNAGAEWANDRGMLRVAYDGSWFTNHQESLTLDNPLVAVSSAAGAAIERYALWPTNRSNTVSGGGAINLPAHSRLNAAVAFGNWRQDTPLLPMTSNPAIPAITLPRTTAEADIRRITTNLSFVTHPASALNISARYRLYDFDDRTPEFIMGPGQNLVEYDVQSEPQSEELVPAHFSHRQNAFEAEATITSLRPVSFGAGYRFNRVSYTTREVEQTKDNAFFAKVDSRNLGMFSLHGTYEHARRRAPDFNTIALTDLPDAGEYPGLRRFDIADRDRDATTLMLQIMPSNMFAVSGSVTAARDKFPNLQFSSTDAFGLQKRSMQGYSVFFDATPRDTVIVSGGYGFQRYNTDQQSRQVTTAPTTPPTGPQLDPRRNWVLNENEKVHYVAASVELTQVIPKTAFRVTYDFNRSESPYTYVLATNSVLTPSVTVPAGTTWPIQLPPINHRWHTATVDVRYFFRKNTAAGVMYWYDRYTVDDQWSMGPNIENRTAVPGILLLGYGFRNYTANSVWLRVQYFF